jgi:outer membrane receptor for ferrienterochelin and colicins
MRHLGLVALALVGSVPASASAQVRVQGKVIEAGTRAPVAGADVGITMPGGMLTGAVRSGTDGAWSLVVPAGDSVVIRVRQLGYAPKNVVLHGDKDVVVVALTPAPIQLDAIVVTASRQPERLKDTPVPTELISRDDIERTGAADLSAVLDQHVGITPTSGHPSGAGVMLQGLGEERVLVLVDGHPVAGRPTGTFDVSRIPTSMVDHVEVVKGPQSTLYGSDAMGGVINIITRPVASGPQRLGLGVVAGSHGRRDVTGEVAGSAGGRVDYLATGGYRTLDVAPGVSESDGAYARRWDALGTLRWTRDSALALETSAMFVGERQRWNAGQLYYFAENQQVNARAGLVWQHGKQRFAPTIHLSHFNHVPLRGTTPQMPSAPDSAAETQQLIEAEVLYSNALGGVALESGLDLKQEEIHSSEVLTGMRRTHTAEPFVQTTFSVGALRVVPGVRLSWNEQWGTHWTPRIATLYRIAPRLALRASFGYGFRAPDFKELYLTWVNDVPGSPYAVKGNPDLRPETARNLTASIEWAGDMLYARVQGFDNHITNYVESMVVGDSGRFTVYTYDNVDRARTRGVDVETGANVGALSVDAGYSYLNTRWLTTGDVLLGRPAHSGRVALTYGLPFGLRTTVTGLYTGSAPVMRDGDSTIFQGAYTRMDLRLAQSLPHELEASFGVINLFDAHPANWPGAAERQVYAGLRWKGGG